MSEISKNNFSKMLYGVSKLYDVYVSENDRDIYMERTWHLVGDWDKAAVAMDTAICKNDQIPTPGDLARFANMRHIEQPTEKRPVKHTMNDNPREEIVKALAENRFKDIYGDLKKVKKSGSGWTNACCPFHEDKSPSFAYNDQHGSWVCRGGCGMGTVFDYEMAMTGESYSEVLHRLAWSMGIEMNQTNDAKGKVTFRKED